MSAADFVVRQSVLLEVRLLARMFQYQMLSTECNFSPVVNHCQMLQKLEKILKYGVPVPEYYAAAR